MEPLSVSQEPWLTVEGVRVTQGRDPRLTDGQKYNQMMAICLLLRCKRAKLEGHIFALKPQASVDPTNCSAPSIHVEFPPTYSRAASVSWLPPPLMLIPPPRILRGATQNINYLRRLRHQDGRAAAKPRNLPVPPPAGE